MSLQNFKSDSYCVGGKHRSATTKIYGGITSKGGKVLIGFCSICNRKKIMAVSHNTMQAGGIGDFFKNLGEKVLNVSEEMTKNVLKNPRRALEIKVNVGSGFASRSPKAAFPLLPEVMIFYHTGEGLQLPSFR